MRVLTPALILALGAAAAQPAAQKSAASSQKSSGGESGGKGSPARKPALSDADLEKAIRARFQKSKISVENFQVRVQGGVATIEGKTSVVQRKGTATRLARLAGARGVVNRIEVSDAARRKASENLASGRRRVQVKRDER